MIPVRIPGRDVDSLDEPAVCDTAVLIKQKTGLPFFGFCKKSFSDGWKTGYLFFEKQDSGKRLEEIMNAIYMKRLFPSIRVIPFL